MTATHRLIASVALVVAGAAAAQAPQDRVEWPKTDFARRTVDLAEIQSGGPPKDGIPAIDRPRFASTDAAKAWLKPKEPVIAIRLAGERRAYPLQILMFHEIVNDEVAGRPVAPFTLLEKAPVINAELAGVPYVVFVKRGTASPLDSERIADGRAIPAATAFDRRLDGRVLEFRPAGTRTVDTATGSEWNLFGEAVAGSLKGRQLAPVESGVHFAFAWLAFNPASEIAAELP
jgi:hypothetical protein